MEGRKEESKVRDCSAAYVDEERERRRRQQRRPNTAKERVMATCGQE